MSHAVLHTRSCAGRCLRSFLAPLQPSAAVRRVITASNDRLRAVETTASTESAGWSEQEQLTSITVDIGQSLERVSVPLRVLGAQLVVVRLQFPLGLVLESASLHLCSSRPSSLPHISMVLVPRSLSTSSASQCYRHTRPQVCSYHNCGQNMLFSLCHCAFAHHMGEPCHNTACVVNVIVNARRRWRGGSRDKYLTRWCC
jgi:hypothetical protein